MYEKYEKLRDSRGVTDYAVAKALGISRSSFTAWKSGSSVPKKEKLQKIADYFSVPLSYFYGEDSEPHYYLDPETAQVAQEIFDDKDLHALFDAARGSSPEDLKMAAEMLRKFKATNPDG